MSHAERRLFALLTDHDHAGDFGLKLGLGAGEAACVAVAVERGILLATNDADALTAYGQLTPTGEHARIRRILRRAADSGILSRAAANEAHEEMTRSGLWDNELPFSHDELRDDATP